MQPDGNTLFTRNLQDIANLLPADDPDSVSRGLFNVTATDPLNPAVDRLVAVDVFSATPEQNFATGQRAPPMPRWWRDRRRRSFATCGASASWTEGLSGGSGVVLYIETSLATPTPSLQVDIYDESGAFRGSTTLTTDDVTQEMPVDIILDAAGVDIAFGSLLVDFADRPPTATSPRSTTPRGPTRSDWMGAA